MRKYELEGERKLHLANDGDLEVFHLGVGSMFATAHYQTNFFLVKGDSHVLVDFGMTGPTAIAETARLNPGAVRAVLPTHSHEDHIGGMSYLGLSNRYIGIPFMKAPKIKMIITEEYEPILWERSLRGSLEYNEVDEHGRPLAFGDYFDIIHPTPGTETPRQTWELQFGDLKLELFRTRHIPEQAVDIDGAFLSYGLFVDDRVFFSCDSQFDRELLEIYDERGAEWYFHDVQFFPGAVHAPLTDLRTLPTHIKEKMFLSHYGDNFGDQDITGFAGWAQQGIVYNFS